MRQFALVILLLGLTGCSYFEMFEDQSLTEQERVEAADDRDCRNSGGIPGTPPYLQCRRRLELQRRNEAATAEARREREQQRFRTGVREKLLLGY